MKLCSGGTDLLGRSVRLTLRLLLPGPPTPLFCQPAPVPSRQVIAGCQTDPMLYRVPARPAIFCRGS